MHDLLQLLGKNGTLTFNVVASQSSGGLPQLNGQTYDPSAPPQFYAQSGTLERWQIVDVSSQVHTFHIHRTHFLVQSVVGGELVERKNVGQRAFAQTKPATQRVLTPGASAYGHELPSILTVRTRAGRTQRVDASEALRSGAYSEPLYIGKLVVETGSVAAKRMLRASSVMRTGNLDAGTPVDR